MIPNGMTIGGYHTYADLSMIPRSKLTVAPAKPKLYTYDLQGVDGDIDLTEVLHGRIAYSNRKGTWDFLVLTGADYHRAYYQCLQVFNGTRRNVVFDDDQDTTYTGRFSINTWKSSEGISQISVDYNIDSGGFDDDD